MWLLLTHNYPRRGKFLMDTLIWFTFTAHMNYTVSVTLKYCDFSAFSLLKKIMDDWYKYVWKHWWKYFAEKCIFLCCQTVPVNGIAVCARPSAGTVIKHLGPRYALDFTNWYWVFPPHNSTIIGLVKICYLVTWLVSINAWNGYFFKCGFWGCHTSQH